MLIDIVVPVYNAWHYIEGFFDTFAAQSDGDVRFLFVDDGSTDNSPVLIEQKARLWGFPCRLLRRDHAGVSAARNFGLASSDAEFVAFFDIDDRPASDYIAGLKQAARTQSFDVFVFAHTRLLPGQSVPQNLGRPTLYHRSARDQLDAFLADPTKLGVYNVLLSRTFLDRVKPRFVEHVAYYEDYAFLYRVFAQAGDVLYTERALYGYVTRDDSAMARFGPERFTCLFVLRAMEDWLARAAPGFAEHYRRWGVARAYWSLLWQAALAAPSFADFRRLYRRTFASVYMKRLRSYPDRRVSLSSWGFTLSKRAYFIAARLLGKSRSQVQRATREQFGAVLSARTPDPRKVLVYGMTDNPGGIESYLMGFLRRQPAGRFDLLCDFPRIAYESELRSRGAEIHFIPAKGKELFGHWRALWRLMWTRPEYTTVYLNVLDAGCAVTALIPWLFGSRIVVHSHNSDTDKQRLHSLCLPWLALMTRGRAACSSAAAAYMFGKRADEALFVPNAVDARRLRFDPAVRAQVRAGLRVDDRPVLCSVGRLSAQKNPLFLLDIFAQARRLCPPAVLLHIGDGELAGEFDEQVRRLGLTGSVLRLGRRSDVPAFLQAADVFLLPSLYEGLPISLVEAQAAGLPCVVSDAVSRQAFLTPLARRMSLSEGAPRWAEAALGLARTPHADAYDAIVRAGFDVSCCAQSDQALLRLLLPDEAFS